MLLIIKRRGRWPMMSLYLSPIHFDRLNGTDQGTQPGLVAFGLLEGDFLVAQVRGAVDRLCNDDPRMQVWFIDLRSSQFGSDLAFELMQDRERPRSSTPEDDPPTGLPLISQSGCFRWTAEVHTRSKASA